MLDSRSITHPCFPRKPNPILETKVLKLGKVGIDAIQSVNTTLKEAVDDQHRQGVAEWFASREFGGHA